MRSDSRATALLNNLRVALAVAVLATSISFAPATALASRLSTDRVGGVRLSSGVVARSKAPDITARNAVLVAGDRVLWSRKSESERAMASTTKIMTALLVLERCDLNKKVKITKTAARTPYASGLRAGERLTVRKLLELTLVASSNDAATALAIHTGGSVKGFSKLMNARAKKLGMTDSRFKNPHGLDAKGHYSSAKDLTKVMRAAIAHTEFRRIIKMKSVKLPKYKKRKARTLRATDKLLGKVTGLRGGKTGFTNDARYCFVASARRDGITLTSAVLGSSSSSARFTSSKRLLDWGFKYYKIRSLSTSGVQVATVPLSNDSSRSVGVVYERSVSAPVLSLMGPVTRVPELPATVMAPVAKGQKLGVVRFIQGSEVIATVNVVAAASVEGTATP